MVDFFLEHLILSLPLFPVTTNPMLLRLNPHFLYHSAGMSKPDSTCFLTLQKDHLRTCTARVGKKNSKNEGDWLRKIYFLKDAFYDAGHKPLKYRLCAYNTGASFFEDHFIFVGKISYNFSSYFYFFPTCHNIINITILIIFSLAVIVIFIQKRKKQFLKCLLYNKY